MHILAIADRGLISHAEVFPSKQEAEAALIKYLKQNEAYKGQDEITAAWRWLDEHDERLNVEIVQQRCAGAPAESESQRALRHVFDLLYLDVGPKGEFLKPSKTWDADTLDAIADVVRPLFPQLPSQSTEDDPDDPPELTPKDRAGFVGRIERVSPYDEGLDAHGTMESPSEFMTDLLTDIRHYCDARGVDFAACDRAAYGHYINERQ